MPLASGQRLGSYEILNSIGAGGMGEVYKARDTRLDRTVAIKVLPELFASDPERAARFEREAQAVAALSHPNILAIHDFGTASEPGRPRVSYAVMELLEGETLRERLDDGPLPLRQVLDFSVQFAHGLAAAHDRGIVHRDLKPENLFITRDDRCKILDFGLARRDIATPVSGDATVSLPRVTDPGTVMGTVGYMAPEQVRGEPGDQRSDIFAFGVVLYEMLTRRRPFHRETGAETMTAILREDPLPLSAAGGATVPPAFERVVWHCLEKKPERRFRSAHDLAFALEALSGSSPQPALDVPPPKPQSWAGGAMLALLGAALIGGVSYWAGSRSVVTPPIARVTYKPLTYGNEIVSDARFTPDGGTVVYSVRDGSGAGRLFMTRLDTVGSSRLSLPPVALLAISPSAELAVATDVAAQFSLIQPPGTLARAPLVGGLPRPLLAGVSFADWNPVDGELAVVVAGTRERLEWPIGKVLYQTNGQIGYPRFSRDGKQLAFLHWPVKNDDRGTVVVVDASGAARTISPAWEGVRGAVWSPDDSEVWYSASTKGEGYQIYASTLSGDVRPVSQAPGSLMVADVDKSGRMLAYDSEREIRVGMLRAGAASEIDLSWLGYSFVRAISLDGKRVVMSYSGATAGLNYNVYVRGVDGSDAVQIGEGQAQQFSPDGAWVLSVIHGPPVRLMLLPTGPGSARDIPIGALEVTDARFLGDGRHLVLVGSEASHGRRLYYADLEGTLRPMSPDNISFPDTMLPVAADGRTAVSAADGRVMIFAIDGASVPVAGLAPGERPIAWVDDDRALLAMSADHARITRVDPVSGARRPGPVLHPSDPAAPTPWSSITFSRDGRSYAANYRRSRTRLFLVEGLR